MAWIASKDRLPPNGNLVLVCDFHQDELQKSFYAAWYAGGSWHSPSVWAPRGEWQPRYWMPIPPLPNQD